MLLRATIGFDYVVTGNVNSNDYIDVYLSVKDVSNDNEKEILVEKGVQAEEKVLAGK